MNPIPPTHFYHPIRFAPLFLGVLALGAHAHLSPTQDWIMCDRGLELSSVAITSIDEDRVQFVDEFGVRRSQRLDDLFFAIAGESGLRDGSTSRSISRSGGTEFSDGPTAPRDEDAAIAYVSLIDGQTIKGSMLNSTDPDSMRITLYIGSTIQGSATIPLEHILAITSIEQPLDLTGSIQDDIVITHNGDRVVGFIESVGLQSTVSTDNGLRQLGFNQIRSLQLANPPEHTPGIYLSTDDGLELRTSRFEVDFQHSPIITIDPVSLGIDATSRDTFLLDPNAPVGIEVLHDQSRIISLASIEPEKITPTGNRSWTPVPIVSWGSSNPILSTIDLRAPVSVMYPLPEGAVRFACTLDAPINTWTDCVASIFAISYTGQRTELVSQQLNAEQSSVSLNADLGSDTQHLEIHIDPGAFGPIQDRVLVKNPRVLIEGD